jgi:molecular chaperone DnaK (HSP70)
MFRFVTILLVSFSGIAGAVPTVVEEHCPAVSNAGTLTEDIGFETLGGVFTPLLRQGCQVPCSITPVFSTADDKQTEIKLFLFRGKSKMTKEAHSLGHFVVLGVPPEPRGVPQIEVTFSVDLQRISLNARDKKSNRALEVKRYEVSSMNYAPLIERAVSTLDGQFSLSDLLARIDAFDHSIPTLEELNAAFAQIRASGRWAALDLSPVSRIAYDEAISKNKERMATFLESRGISRTKQQQLLHDSEFKSREP